MDNKDIENLLLKYREGTCSDAEKALLENWILFGEFNEQQLTNTEIEQELSVVSHGLPLFKSRMLWPRIAVAASIILCISFGGYYLLRSKQPQQYSYYKNDIPAGRNQATLTLANGKKIILTKGLTGELAQQGTTTIQINNGITYTPGLTAVAGKTITYNTLSTAIGEQSPYPLILSDGSKVWLNAQSSITFPTAFNGKERIVKITGEALFEVAHNAKQPFKVQTEKQTIEDIGTTFDVNAYANEPVTKTTLIEGKVRVNNIILEPGQQSDGTHISTVNTKRFSAWKNGDFYFEDDNIQTVMRQLSRWYNIEINYEGNVTTNGFNAQISRSKNIGAILHILENTKGVHFKIEGRRVTVIE